MFSRWKNCSFRCVICVTLFIIIDLIFVWGFLISKPTTQLVNEPQSLSHNSHGFIRQILPAAIRTEIKTETETETETDSPSNSRVLATTTVNVRPVLNVQGGNFKGPFSELQFSEWLNRDTWKQDDPELVESVRKKFLIPPSKEPYQLSLSNAVKRNPSDGQVQAVERFLKKLTPGFFIESGANDGELNSNTIWLEKEMGWTGLLVEADPYAFDRLKKKNRKAWLANVCLSGLKYPKKVTFFINTAHSEAGGLIFDPYYGATTPVGAQSIPLYTILLALNRTTVDFFSLDVEGNELQILKTIPFESVTFKILTIEHLFIEEGKRALWNFMKSKGYILYKTIKTKNTGDSIFLHPSVVKEVLSHEIQAQSETVFLKSYY